MLQETCDGRDEDCDGEVDEAVCVIGFLGDGAGAWEHRGASDAESPYRSAWPVEAAVDMNDLGVIWVLTAGRVYVYDVEARSWDRSFGRDANFRELAGRTVVGAYSVPLWWLRRNDAERETGVVRVHTRAGAVLEYDFEADGSLQLREVFEVLDPEPRRPPFDQMVGVTLDLLNSRGSWPGSPAQLCPDGPQALGPTLVLATQDAFHPNDAGWCFGFVEPIPHEAWRPLGLPGAPDPASTGAFVHYSSQQPDDPSAGYYFFAP